MSHTGGKHTRIISLASYLILAILIIVSLRFALFEGALVWLVGVCTLLIIRDLILFFGVSRNVTHRVFDWRKFSVDFRQGGASVLDGCILLFRGVIFPLLLIVYILVILLKQLDIFSFLAILSSNSWIEYSLLGGVTVSGLITLVRESLDTRYYKYIPSRQRTRFFVLLTIVLAVSSVVIIFQQTSSLGLLSIPIGIISGILVFLVGMLLLEEE